MPNCTITNAKALSHAIRKHWSIEPRKPRRSIAGKLEGEQLRGPHHEPQFTGLPDWAAKSLLPFHMTTFSTALPRTCRQASTAKPGISLPEAPIKPTWHDPIADVLRFSSSRLPWNTSGGVTSSPPPQATSAETKPSSR